MDLLAEKQKLVGRTFRHFKGKLYRLEGFAKDSETLEEMAVYRALYGECGLWVRPAKMFFETIERDGKTMKRFELVEDEKQERSTCSDRCVESNSSSPTMRPWKS